MNRREFIKTSAAVVGVLAIGDIQKPAYSAPMLPLQEGCIYYDQYFKYNTPSAKAGFIIADVWKKVGLPKIIDMWGFDDVNPEFVDAFFGRCKENGVLRESMHVWWGFHCCPGPEEWATLYDYFPEWTKDFLNRTEGTSFPINPAIHKNFDIRFSSDTCDFIKERADHKSGNEPWKYFWEKDFAHDRARV